MPKSRRFTLKSTEELLEDWRRKHAALTPQAESTPARRDMTTLLEYVRDNKVVGTQAAGNMPLKAIREVSALFVEPPELESRTGDHTYRIRSELDVWPVYFLRVLAEIGGLLKTGQARLWQLTPQARRFLKTEPLVQTAFLLTAWWYRINWIIAYPYEGMGSRLPDFFSYLTLTRLFMVTDGLYYRFDSFSDQVIDLSGMSWGAQESRFARSALHHAIQKMVIDILAGFDAVEKEYREELLGKLTIDKLVAFRVTPWGKALIEALAVTGDIYTEDVKRILAGRRSGRPEGQRGS